MKIMSTFEQYTTLDSFNKLRMGLERDIEGFKVRFKRCTEMEDLENLEGKMKMFVFNELKPLSAKRDCNKDKNELMKLFTNCMGEITKTNDAARVVKSRTLKLENDIETKAKKEEINRLSDTVKILPTKEEVQEMRQIVFGKIEEFDNDNQTHE